MFIAISHMRTVRLHPIHRQNSNTTCRCMNAIWYMNNHNLLNSSLLLWLNGTDRMKAGIRDNNISTSVFRHSGVYVKEMGYCAAEQRA